MTEHLINTNKNINEYENKHITLDSYPQIVFIETTRNCNLKCPMCERAQKYGNKNDKSLNMDLDLLKKIENELFQYAEIIDYHGNGEFLCYPYFHEALKLARQHNCRIRTVTNLMTRDKARLDALLKDDVILCISIDSPYKTQYEKLRYGASFDLLCENLEYIKNSKKKDITVMMTLAKDNIHSLKDMMFFLKKYGIKKLCIWNRYLNIDDQNNINYHIDAANAQISNAFKEAKELGIEIRLLAWPCFDEQKYTGLSLCVKPWMSIHINYDGSIGMCDFNETPDIFRNLNITKIPFNEIWNSKEYQKLRKAFLLDENIEFCSEFCIGKRFIDFEDILYPKSSKFIVGSNSNENII